MKSRFHIIRGEMRMRLVRDRVSPARAALIAIMAVGAFSVYGIMVRKHDGLRHKIAIYH